MDDRPRVTQKAWLQHAAACASVSDKLPNAIPVALPLAAAQMRKALLTSLDLDEVERPSPDARLTRHGKRKATEAPVVANSKEHRGSNAVKLSQIKADLLELEQYIPWTVVTASWFSKRAAWARKTEACQDASAVAWQLVVLEKSILRHAFEIVWRDVSFRRAWHEEVLNENDAGRVQALMHEMEDRLQWTRLKQWPTLAAAFKKLLKIPAGARLKELSQSLPAEGEHEHRTKTLQQIKKSLDTFCYSGADHLAAACCALAAQSPDSKELRKAICEVLDVSEESLNVAHCQGESSRQHGEGSRQVEGLRQGDSSAEELQEEMRQAGVDASRAIEKKLRYREFKEKELLHPEFNGVYADDFARTKQEMRHFQELLVFRRYTRPDMIVGLLQIHPHTTMLELRQMLRDDFGLAEHGNTELLLSRGSISTHHSAANNESSGTPLADPELCPILRTQNHKLVSPFFPRPEHALVVNEKRIPDLSADSVLFKRMAARAQPNERLLCLDISRGQERHPIPIFNGTDGEPVPAFTYVVSCVVSQGTRLLVGGPQRDPWPCPFEGDMSSTESQPYDRRRRFRFAPNTARSIYECTLMSTCGDNCANRLVQHGSEVHLEIFRCRGDGRQRHSKGWGVRCAHRIPKGAFICEYIGEYISDDEAESRGIRYDNQKMSRLMEVVGDGEDTVDMCIDATKYSNLGRFLNHSCDPNCFKQRVFCDHNHRLPRLAFFALRDIEPLDELCYDYGYKDVPGKTMPCLCNAKGCKKLLY